MRYIDLAVILAYLLAITWFGARFRAGQKSLRDYFLGGRTAPWWAISLSIVSAETSTLTIVGTPALAFNGNMGFLQIVLGTGEIGSIALITVLTLFYTFEGGMTAVIWTDVVQMTLYVLGAILSFFIILGKIPGGWEHVVLVAGAAHKFTIFDFRFSPDMQFFSRTYSFWAGIAGGCFLTTATHGTDQLMVQRLLSARDERQSRTALLSSWFV